VSNLEHINIRVDFLKLENAADRILQNCENLAWSPAVEAGDHNEYTCGLARIGNLCQNSI